MTVFHLLSSDYSKASPGLLARHAFASTGHPFHQMPLTYFAEFGMDFQALMAQCEGLRENPEPGRTIDLLARLIVELLAMGRHRIKRQEGRLALFEREPSGLTVTHEYVSKSQTAAAVALANRLVSGAADAETCRLLAEDVRRFAEVQRALVSNPTSGAIVLAAEARGVPWLWSRELDLFQLGHGRKQKRIEATITQHTSSLAVTVARNKRLTNHLLRSQGLPAPRHEVVDAFPAALAAAESIGFPVVVKPQNGNKGKGITVGVTDAAALEQAYHLARRVDRQVLVEEVLPGRDHRLLVVGGRMVSAVLRMPAQIVGDGKSSIGDLIYEENGRRRRSVVPYALPLGLSAETDAILERQGFTQMSVPAEGQGVLLQTAANWSQGGTATDVTDDVHPDNRDMAIRAANCIGLDVAGIDFITPDISRSYRETGGGICEVNYRPGLRVHFAALRDLKRDIAGTIVDHLIDGNGRIPIAYVVEDNSSACAQILCALLSKDGRNTAVVQGGKLVRTVEGTEYEQAQECRSALAIALQDPDIETVIVALGPGDDAASLCAMAPPSLAIRAEAAQEDLWSIVSNAAERRIEKCDCREFADPAGLAAQAAKLLTVDGAKPRLPGGEMTRGSGSMESEDREGLTISQYAARRGLPVQSLLEWNDQPLMQLGTGAFQARYRAAMSSKTTQLAVLSVDHKARTARLLRMHGLPSAQHRVVKTIEEARHAAKGLGYPLIVKPLSSSESRGVTGGIANDLDLARAVKAAKKFSSRVIVEKFLTGDDHRILVIGGKATHVTRTEPASVIGNGADTVQELVRKANLDPLRGPERSKPYVVIEINDDVKATLRKAGLEVTSVPERGRRVGLSSISSLSSGGIAVDMTANAHPDNLQMAERAARIADLDICGVDFLTPDISRSYRDVGGAIVEINRRPSFDAHDASTDWHNDVRATVVDWLYENSGNVPSLPLAIVRQADDGTLSESALLLHHILLMSGGSVGLAVLEAGYSIVGPYRSRMGNLDIVTRCRSFLNDKRAEKAIIAATAVDAEVRELFRGAVGLGDASGQAGKPPLSSRLVAAARGMCSESALAEAVGTAKRLGVQDQRIARAIDCLYPAALRCPCVGEVVELAGNRTLILGVSHPDYAPGQLADLAFSASSQRPPVLLFDGGVTGLEALLKQCGQPFGAIYRRGAPDTALAQAPSCAGIEAGQVVLHDDLKTLVAQCLADAPEGAAILCLTADPEAVLSQCGRSR